MIKYDNKELPVIDVHTHFIGDYRRFDPLLHPIFERVQPFQKDHFDIKDVARSLSALMEYLDKAGIDQICLMAEEGPPTFYSVPTELCLGFASMNPERLFVIGNVNPRIEKNLPARVKNLIRGGVIAFKLYAADHNQNPYDKALNSLYEQCNDKGLPIFFHSGATSRYPLAQNRYGDPLYWEKLVAKYTNVAFIMCHGGKGGFENNCLKLLEKYPNAYVDIADMSPQMLTRIDSAEFSDRLMFGTDMPQFPDYGMLLERVLESPLSLEVKTDILYNNAARVLRLPERIAKADNIIRGEAHVQGQSQDTNRHTTTVGQAV